MESKRSSAIVTTRPQRCSSARRLFAQVRDTGFRLSGGETRSIQELYAAFAMQSAHLRGHEDVIRALEQVRSLIGLTERKDHLEYLVAQVGKLARHVVVLQRGGTT